jgi:hypothetical protein
MFKEVMNDLWLARISSLSNEVGLYVVLLEVLLFRKQLIFSLGNCIYLLLNKSYKHTALVCPIIHAIGS